MRVALAHDYLTQRGGAERVVLALSREFSDAPILTAAFDPNRTFSEFGGKDVRTSALQRFAFLRRDPRRAFFFLPAVWSWWRRTDNFDVVVVSSSGWAHGLRRRSGCAHIVYCHNPPRWLYQADEYATSFLVRLGVRVIGPVLRLWDRSAAKGIDAYIANSSVVAERIRRVYGVDPTVIHPPIYIDQEQPGEPVPGLSAGFWLVVARARGYKNVLSVVDGFSRLGEGDLVVVGAEADSYPRMRNVHFLGVVSDAQLAWLYRNARALVSVAYEDFGLTPIEANSFGTPCAVLRAGGFLDSTVEGVSGQFIDAATPDAVERCLRDFPQFDEDVVKRHSERFSAEVFGRQVRDICVNVVSTRERGL